MHTCPHRKLPDLAGFAVRHKAALCHCDLTDGQVEQRVGISKCKIGATRPHLSAWVWRHHIRS